MPAIDNFNAWLVKDHAWVYDAAQVYGELFTRNEIKKQRVWIEANPRKGRKKNYRRFFTNWMNKCEGTMVKSIQLSSICEEAYYESKKRGHTKSDFEQA